MPFCTHCNTETDDLFGACSRCAQKYQSSSGLSDATKLHPPSPRTAQIICHGHGTYTPIDGQVIVPINMSIYFRCGHTSTTMGRNEEEYLPGHSIRAGGTVTDYRLWSLTGSEKVSLPKSQTYSLSGGLQELEWPMVKIHIIKPGSKYYFYINQPGQSILLSTIIRLLQNYNNTIHYEILWLACREVVNNHREFAILLSRQESSIEEK